MKTRETGLIAGLLMLISIAPALRAADEPSTQPAPATRPAAGGRFGGGGGGGGGGFGGNPVDRWKRLLDGIKLTDDQQKKIDAIFETAKNDAAKMREESQNLAPQERMQKMREFMRDVRDKVSNELDDAQKKTFQENVETARQRMQNGGGGGGGNGPATQPGQFANRMIERATESLQKLELTDEQKTKIKSLVDETKDKIQKLRDEAQADAQQAREKGRQVFQDFRDSLNSILTPEQSDKFRELMQQGGPGGGGGGFRPGGGNRNGGGGGSGNDQKKQDAPKGPNARSDVAPDVPRVAEGPPDIVGKPAPDFALVKLDGLPVRLSSFKGRVLVIEFGSWSCPSFRDRADEMEKLKRDYNRKAEFLVIYTKEAHPAGDWDVARNKTDGISVVQPDNDTTRRALAKKAKDTLKISLPIAIDAMNNSTADAYGRFPNGAVVIARDGTVFAAQQWMDPSGLGKLIDQAVTPPAATQPH